MHATIYSLPFHRVGGVAINGFSRNRCFALLMPGQPCLSSLLCHNLDQTQRKETRPNPKSGNDVRHTLSIVWEQHDFPSFDPAPKSFCVYGNRLRCVPDWGRCPSVVFRGWRGSPRRKRRGGGPESATKGTGAGRYILRLSYWCRGTPSLAMWCGGYITCQFGTRGFWSRCY